MVLEHKEKNIGKHYWPSGKHKFRSPSFGDLISETMPFVLEGLDIQALTGKAIYTWGPFKI